MTLPKLSAARRGLARAQTVLINTLRRTPLAPKNTIVVRYTGPKSGRTIELPVWAVHDSANHRWIVGVGAADVKTWWRTFRQPVSATLRDTAGRTHKVSGVLLTGERKAQAQELFFRQIPSARRAFGADPPFLEFTLAWKHDGHPTTPKRG